MAEEEKHKLTVYFSDGSSKTFFNVIEVIVDSALSGTDNSREYAKTLTFIQKLPEYGREYERKIVIPLYSVKYYYFDDVTI